MTIFVYKTVGTYFGFISNGSLFSRDGIYLGWIDGQYVWDSLGKFRGQLFNDKYIVVNRFTVQPVPKPPRSKPVSPVLPNPPPNIAPIVLQTGWVDAF